MAVSKMGHFLLADILNIISSNLACALCKVLCITKYCI